MICSNNGEHAFVRKKKSSMQSGTRRRGTIHSQFECTEYLISGDHVSDLNDFKFWYHRLHIIPRDFSKLYMIWIIFIRFKCDFTRFPTLFVKIWNRWLKSRLTWFMWLHLLFRTEWVNFTYEWPVALRIASSSFSIFHKATSLMNYVYQN